MIVVVVAEEPLPERTGIGQRAEPLGEDRGVLQRLERGLAVGAVSYTHLTLPTSDLV